ncbi:hypothetical protein NDU88_000640 [Pleurodeles waltl]|uniref:Uncharacterized protein n=1 Tax=Pleurodeles waltl TaxID=8319 RepID=A0AAV7USC0_PLEWA|nr:hypothetical protein NDU88_000640 [Pleurodeles waltl]
MIISFGLLFIKVIDTYSEPLDERLTLTSNRRRVKWGELILTPDCIKTQYDTAGSALDELEKALDEDEHRRQWSRVGKIHLGLVGAFNDFFVADVHPRGVRKRNPSLFNKQFGLAKIACLRH